MRSKKKLSWNVPGSPRNLFPQNLLSDRRQRARDIDLSMGERECSALFLEEIGGWEMAAKK
jgi:hypothetical protein